MVTLGTDTTGTFATRNVGSNIAVTTAMTLGGADAGNYILTQPTGLTANISPYVLSLNGTRVYDGGTDARQVSSAPPASLPGSPARR